MQSIQLVESIYIFLDAQYLRVWYRRAIYRLFHDKHLLMFLGSRWTATVRRMFIFVDRIFFSYKNIFFRHLPYELFFWHLLEKSAYFIDYFTSGRLENVSNEDFVTPNFNVIKPIKKLCYSVKLYLLIITFCNIKLVGGCFQYVRKAL